MATLSIHGPTRPAGTKKHTSTAADTLTLTDWTQALYCYIDDATNNGTFDVETTGASASDAVTIEKQTWTMVVPPGSRERDLTVTVTPGASADVHYMWGGGR